jgi:hypothetical protein
MSLADRCDEITRLIDATLREIASGVTAEPASEVDEPTSPVHSTDGRWAQRRIPEDPFGAAHAAA